MATLVEIWSFYLSIYNSLPILPRLCLGCWEQLCFTNFSNGKSPKNHREANGRFPSSYQELGNLPLGKPRATGDPEPVQDGFPGVALTWIQPALSGFW